MKDEKEKRQTTLVYNQALHKCSVGKKVREHEKFSNRHIFLRKDFSIKDKQNPGNIYLYTQKHTHTKTCIYSIITEHESVFNRHKRQLKNIVELIKATLMKKIETVKDQMQKKKKKVLLLCKNRHSSSNPGKRKTNPANENSRAILWLPAKLISNFMH